MTGDSNDEKKVEERIERSDDEKATVAETPDEDPRDRDSEDESE